MIATVPDGNSMIVLNLIFRYFLPLKEKLTNVDRLRVAPRHLAPGRLQPRNGLLRIQHPSDSDFSDVTSSPSIVVVCRFDVRGLFVPLWV